MPRLSRQVAKAAEAIERPRAEKGSSPPPWWRSARRPASTRTPAPPTIAKRRKRAASAPARSPGTLLLRSERRNAEKEDALLLHPRAAEAVQNQPAAAEQEGDDEHPG